MPTLVGEDIGEGTLKAVEKTMGMGGFIEVAPNLVTAVAMPIAQPALEMRNRMARKE